MNKMKIALSALSVALFAAPAFAQDNSVQFNDDVSISEAIDLDTDLSADLQARPDDGVNPMRWVRVRCLSRNGEYRQCGIGFRERIEQARLQRQFSYRPCIANRTWGATRRFVWVSNGCQGDFLVYTTWRGGGGGRPGRPGNPGNPGYP